MLLTDTIYPETDAYDEALEHDGDLSVGGILKRTREHYQQSHEDVERAIRVRAEQIVDIERDSVESLPGPVYAVGFVRAYSEYLGLDGDKMVAQFKAQKGADKKSVRLDFPLPSYDGKLPSKWIVWLSFFLVFAGPYVIWSLSGGETQQALEIEPVPESMKMSAKGVVPDFSNINAVVEDEAISEVLLNVLESTWVEIKNEQGIVLISKVLEAGEQYYVPNDPTLAITIGDGGVVQYRDEKGQFKAFGQRGVSVRNKPLRLLRDFPKPPPMPRRDVGRDAVPASEIEDTAVDEEAGNVSNNADDAAPVVEVESVEDAAVERAEAGDDLGTLENTLAPEGVEGLEESQAGVLDAVPIPPRIASEGKAQIEPQIEPEGELTTILDAIVPRIKPEARFDVND